MKFAIAAFLTLAGEMATAGCPPALRQEWRELPEATQASYIEAVKCLRRLPSKIGLETSHYDDFSYVHSQLNIQSMVVLARNSHIFWG